jgi:hypothetical protein
VLLKSDLRIHCENKDTKTVVESITVPAASYVFHSEYFRLMFSHSSFSPSPCGCCNKSTSSPTSEPLDGGYCVTTTAAVEVVRCLNHYILTGVLTCDNPGLFLDLWVLADYWQVSAFLEACPQALLWFSHDWLLLTKLGCEAQVSDNVLHTLVKSVFVVFDNLSETDSVEAFIQFPFRVLHTLTWLDVALVHTLRWLELLCAWRSHHPNIPGDEFQTFLFQHVAWTGLCFSSLVVWLEQLVDYMPVSFVGGLYVYHQVPSKRPHLIKQFPVLGKKPLLPCSCRDCASVVVQK